MRDSKFRELVNSYLDNEISEYELHLLKLEMKGNPRRKKIFQEYYCLHHVFRAALAGDPGCLEAPEEKSSGRRMAAFFGKAGLLAACGVVLFAFLFSNHFHGKEGNKLEIAQQSARIPAISSSATASFPKVKYEPRKVLRRQPLVLAKVSSFPSFSLQSDQSLTSSEEKLLGADNPGSSLLQDAFLQINPNNRAFPAFDPYPRPPRGVIIKNGEGNNFRPELAGFTFQK